MPVCHLILKYDHNSSWYHTDHFCTFATTCFDHFITLSTRECVQKIKSRVTYLLHLTYNQFLKSGINNSWTMDTCYFSTCRPTYHFHHFAELFKIRQMSPKHFVQKALKVQGIQVTIPTWVIYQSILNLINFFLFYF